MKSAAFRITALFAMLLATALFAYSDHDHSGDHHGDDHEKHGNPHEQHGDMHEHGNPHEQHGDMREHGNPHYEGHGNPHHEEHGNPHYVHRDIWERDRAHNWQHEHHTWRERGGYHGYRIPDERFHA